MRKIKLSEDAYCDIQEMFLYISQDKIVYIRNVENHMRLKHGWRLA